MGKALVAVLGTTATAAVAAPVTFLAINGSGGAGEESSSDISPEEHNQSSISTQKPTKSSWQGKKIPALAKSSDIKSKYREIDCLKDHYGAGDEWKGQVLSGMLDEQLVNQENISKSCLIVEYYKETVKDGRWRGGFRLTWSVVGSSQGMVTELNADTNDGKLILDTSVYFLEKGGNGSWSLKYKEENSKHDISNSNDLSEYFPNSGNSMNADVEGKYWGFNPEIEKICKGEECSGDVKTINSTTWKWTKNDEANGLLTDWNSNFHNWFQKLFPNWFQIPNQLIVIKGTWTKQTQ